VSGADATLVSVYEYENQHNSTGDEKMITRKTITNGLTVAVTIAVTATFLATASAYAAPWTPAETTTVLWLDADDASTIHTDDAAGFVSQWDDKSGNANNASQGTGTNKQPALGSSSIVFDGTDDGFDFAKDITNSVVNVFEVYSTVDTGYITCFAQAGGPGWPYVAQNASGNTTINRLFGSPAYWTNGTAVSPTTRDDVYTLFSTGSDVIVECIGGDMSDSVWTTYGFNYGDNGGFLNFDGALKELIITTGTLSANDRQKFEGYLAWKWDGGVAGTLVNALPFDHEYKAAAPGAPPPGTVLVIR
jgi:hypothetical protein